jgi:hypothetical protein
MQRLVRQCVVLLAFAGLIAVARPARAQDCSSATVAGNVTVARDIVVANYDPVNINKCSVSVSIGYLNQAISLLGQDNRSAALLRLRAAAMCFCTLSREINPATHQPYQTLPPLQDLAAWWHNPDAQFIGQVVCDLLNESIDCLD